MRYVNIDQSAMFFAALHLESVADGTYHKISMYVFWILPFHPGNSLYQPHSRVLYTH